MKRSASRFLSAATALALSMTTISSLGVITASAESYGLIIGTTKVTDENCDNIDGNGVFKYSPAEKKLTINGDYTGVYTGFLIKFKRAVVSDIDDLTIEVAGDSTINGRFVLNENTTITGSGHLNVDYEDCIVVPLQCEKTLKFVDADVYVSGSSVGVGWSGSDTMPFENTIEIDNSKLHVKVNDDTSDTRYALGYNKFFMNGCIIETPTEGYIGKNNILTKSGTPAKEVLITPVENYGIDIGDVHVNSMNKDDVMGDGKVSYNSDTKTLTLNGGTYGFINNNKVDGLTINVAADTTINNKKETVNYGRAFEIWEKTTITGEGKLNVSAPSAGIAVWYDATLTIKDANVDITSPYALSGPEMDKAGESLTVINSNVNIHSTKCAISDFNGGVILKDCKITTPESAVISDRGYVYESDGTTEAGNVVIEPVEKIKVDKVDISVKKPVAGNAPTFKSRTDTEGVELYTRSRSTSKLGIGRFIKTKNSVQWYDGKTALTRTDKFEAGKTYTAKLYVVPTDGYVFSDNVEITINGKKAVFGGTDIKNGGLFSVDFDAAATDGEDETPTDGEDGVKGDVNGDGAVTITDVSKVAAHIKSKKLLTEEEQKRADVNGDGKVDVTDLSKIAAHVKGKKQLV